MKIPKNYNEDQVIDIIVSISNKLASKFKFGYHEAEDIKQQIFLEILKPDKNGITILEKYDEERGKSLESFLWVYARNRLHNFKRDNFARPDKPCDACPFNAYKNKQCTKYKNMQDCDLYSKWEARNKKKQTLMTTYEYHDIHFSDSDNLIESMSNKKIYNLVDKNIPPHMREDWIRFINKAKLSKTKKDILINYINNIIRENDINES